MGGGGERERETDREAVTCAADLACAALAVGTVDQAVGNTCVDGFAGLRGRVHVKSYEDEVEVEDGGTRVRPQPRKSPDRARPETGLCALQPLRQTKSTRRRRPRIRKKLPALLLTTPPRTGSEDVVPPAHLVLEDDVVDELHDDGFVQVVLRSDGWAAWRPARRDDRQWVRETVAPTTCGATARTPSRHRPARDGCLPATDCLAMPACLPACLAAWPPGRHCLAARAPRNARCNPPRSLSVCPPASRIHPRCATRTPPNAMPRSFPTYERSLFGGIQCGAS